MIMRKFTLILAALVALVSYAQAAVTESTKADMFSRVTNTSVFAHADGKIKPTSKNAVKRIGGTTLVTPPADVVNNTKTYSASAFCFMDRSSVRYDVEVGMDGSSMYIQGLFRNNPQTWIVGTVSDDGKTVTFAKDQYMGESPAIDAATGEDLGMVPSWLEYSEDFESYCDFVMTIAPDGIMNDAKNGLLAFAINDQMMAIDALGYLRLTPAELYADASYDLVTPPAGMDIIPLNISGFSNETKSQKSSVGMMIIDGNDMYIQGLGMDMGAAWVKGTINGDKVTFRKGQYLGKNSGYDLWFMSVNPKDGTNYLKDAEATWNAEEMILEFPETSAVVENADPASMICFDTYLDVIVEPLPEDAGIILPPKNMVSRPYETTVKSDGRYQYAKSSYIVNIGFDGDDAYMQGLLYFAPTTWIKGTRNADGSLTFQKNQYIGTVKGYDVYVVPCDNRENVKDEYTFKYDKANDKYTYTERNTKISFSIATDSTDAVEIISSVVMKGDGNVDAIENVITTASDAIYDLSGRQLKTMQKGINIVKSKNGKTVKVMNL